MNPRSLVLSVAIAVSTVGLALYLTRGTEASLHAGGPPEVRAPAAGSAHTAALPAHPSPEVESASGAQSPAALPALVPLPEAGLAGYRKSLLDLAHLTASAIPKTPHVKTRSRAQEQVAAACLELEQPRLALEVVESIDNWRRGVGYADLAYYGARQGDASAMAPYLERARVEAERMLLEGLNEEQGFDGDDEALEGYQAWRRDRIRAKIARTYILLGQEDKAIEFEDGLEPSEVGLVQVARARTLPRDQVRSAAERLDSVAAEGNLELVRNALDVALELLARFYAEPELNALLREKLEACFTKTPLLVQVDGLISIASIAVDRSDPSTALKLVERAGATLALNPLAIEDELPLRTRLAELAHRAGEPERARRELEAVVQRFDAARAQITNLRRTEILLPIAEAYARMGDAGAAGSAYRRAAVEGAENPNAIPRAEDLVTLCLSLARNDVEPDAELWRSIRATHAGLREPW